MEQFQFNPIFILMKDLLLLLCHYPYNPADRERLRNLLSTVDDWDKTVNLINEHGIIALADFNIREACLTEMVPEHAMAILEDGRMQSVARNAWLAERWKEVNKILSEAEIKHLLLKGMALEYTAYGGQGLRQMTDNDILIKREDALKAWYLLQEYGFIPEMVKSPLHNKIIMCLGKHLPSLNKDGYMVEIHHRLFNDPGKNEILNDAINNAKEINISGTKAFILQDDIHLLFLREHFNRHILTGESQLRLYADMEILSKGNAPGLPDIFIFNPKQFTAIKYRRNAYLLNYNSIPHKHRLRYLAGDIFPSLKWMKNRYNCGTFSALLLYPGRIFKLFWLTGKVHRVVEALKG